MLVISSVEEHVLIVAPWRRAGGWWHARRLHTDVAAVGPCFVETSGGSSSGNVITHVVQRCEAVVAIGGVKCLIGNRRVDPGGAGIAQRAP